jgi:SAM-dependent methyltransferase
MNVQSNWWENFFEGAAVDLWLRAVSPEQTTQEANLLERLLEIPNGSEVLDVPCGGGRLALEFGRRGYRVTGVDWSEAFLDHGRSHANAGVVRWERRDMRDLPWQGRFAGAYCVGNSFGYLDDEGNVAFLKAVANALEPGGRFVLETPMILENLLGHLQHRPWWQVDDLRLLIANEYDPARQRLEIEYTFVDNGRVDVRRGSHRAYTYRELVELLERSGFVVNVAEPWRRDAHNVTFIGTKGA